MADGLLPNRNVMVSDMEFHSAPHFAEVAEALGVNTVDVMAVLPDQTALWTTENDTDDPKIWSCQLDRNADGILFAHTPKYISSTSAFREELKKLKEKVEV